MQERYARIQGLCVRLGWRFNDGYKNDAGSSPFSELDAMGTNRFVSAITCVRA